VKILLASKLTTLNGRDLLVIIPEFKSWGVLLEIFSKMALQNKLDMQGSLKVRICHKIESKCFKRVIFSASNTLFGNSLSE